MTLFREHWINPVEVPRRTPSGSPTSYIRQRVQLDIAAQVPNLDVQQEVKTRRILEASCVILLPLPWIGLGRWSGRHRRRRPDTVFGAIH